MKFIHAIQASFIWTNAKVALSFSPYSYAPRHQTLTIPNLDSKSTHTHVKVVLPRRSNTNPPFLFMSSGEDDFYSDYDPSVYDEYNNNNDDPYDASDGRRYNSRSKNRSTTSRYNPSLGHDYTRDTSRDNSNIDEQAVNQLLSDRLQARKRRDFDTADAIRDELLKTHSVGVYDRERTWRTGCSSSGSGMKFGGGGNGRGGDRNGSRGRRPRRERDFGPNGHDYHLSADAGPISSRLSEQEIHGLLAERLQAKMNRNFDVADSIQTNLISEGVYVHDAMKEWRADGVPFGDFGSNGRGPSRTAGSRSDRNRGYQKSKYSLDLGDEIDDAMVEKLLNERSKYKMLRSYDEADAIREGLKKKYNVIVDDRIREWSVGGDFGEDHTAQRELAMAMSNRGYIKSASSLDLSPEDEEYVTQRIQTRHEAKMEQDYETADAIRQELEISFDVTIQDKLKQWSVGGL